MIPIMCVFIPGSPKIHLTGGSNGDYTRSLSGRKIPESAILEEVLDVVSQITDIKEYNLRDLHYLQWEDWSQIVLFSPIEDVRKYVIEPMLANGMAHNKWQDLVLD